MTAPTRPSNWIPACITLFLSAVDAQGFFGGPGNGDGDGNGPFQFGGSGNGDGDNPFSSANNSFDFISTSQGNRALIAHAVIASAVWVLLIPFGGILLRLNIRSSWVLRVHAAIQIISYVLYIVAVGLGIWLARSMSFFNYSLAWSGPHPALGLAILTLAFFQPILGATHHAMFKKHAANLKDGMGGPAPGRTVPGRMHLWLGRVLIILGMINGGLGIRLASMTPFQSSSTTRTAAVVYGTIAGVVFLIYFLVVVRFEATKSKREGTEENAQHVGIAMDDAPPTYAQSQESLQKQHTAVTRYH